MTDNVELAARGYEAFARRDIDGLLALLDPDVVFTSLIQESEGGEYRGYEGVREFLHTVGEVLPDWRPEMVSAEDHGDAVLVKARIRVTVPDSEVPLEQVMWQVLRIRDGLGVRWDFFRTEAEARPALTP